MRIIYIHYPQRALKFGYTYFWNQPAHTHSSRQCAHACARVEQAGVRFKQRPPIKASTRVRGGGLLTKSSNAALAHSLIRMHAYITSIIKNSFHTLHERAQIKNKQILRMHPRWRCSRWGRRGAPAHQCSQINQSSAIKRPLDGSHARDTWKCLCERAFVPKCGYNIATLHAHARKHMLDVKPSTASRPLQSPSL